MALAGMSSKGFVEDVLLGHPKCRACCFAGFNYTFGRDGGGTAGELVNHLCEAWNWRDWWVPPSV